MSQPVYPGELARGEDSVIRELATVLQLGRRARDAERIEVVGFVAVNETHQLFAYRQAALARVGEFGRNLAHNMDAFRL